MQLSYWSQEGVLPHTWKADADSNIRAAAHSPGRALCLAPSVTQSSKAIVPMTCNVWKNWFKLIPSEKLCSRPLWTLRVTRDKERSLPPCLAIEWFSRSPLLQEAFEGLIDWRVYVYARNLANWAVSSFLLSMWPHLRILTPGVRESYRLSSFWLSTRWLSNHLAIECCRKHLTIEL